MKNPAMFLLKLRNDVFKLLPMKENFDKGKDNHLIDYLQGLIITTEGGTTTFEDLLNEKAYIYVITNLNYIYTHSDIDFRSWRKIILNCTRSLDDLKIKFGGGETANE